LLLFEFALISLLHSFPSPRSPKETISTSKNSLKCYDALRGLSHFLYPTKWIAFSIVLYKHFVHITKYCLFYCMMICMRLLLEFLYSSWKYTQKELSSKTRTGRADGAKATRESE
jgi:hypothetical protein